MARRANLWDRAGKWARRHRTLAAAAAVSLAVVLVGSLAGTLLIAAEHAKTKAALAQAETNFHQAEENLSRAETHFRQLREVVDRFGAYHAERLKDLPGVEPLRRELLLDTLNYYREFIRYASDDPTLQADLAVTYSKAAAVSEQIGDKAAALAAYRQAAEAFTQLAAAHPAEPRYQADLALCQNNLGLLLAATGKTQDAEDGLSKRPGNSEAAQREQPDSADFQRDLALTYGNLGLLARTVNQPDRAEQNYREAIRIQEQLAAKHADQPEYLHHLAISYNNLSFLQAKSEPVKAEESSRKARAIQEQLAAAHPANTEYQSDLALSYNNLGALESYNGRTEQAAASYGRAIAIQQQLVRKSPAVTRFRRDLAISHNNLGRVFSKSKQKDLAGKSFESARAIMKELVDDDPQELSYRSSLGRDLQQPGHDLGGASSPGRGRGHVRAGDPAAALLLRPAPAKWPSSASSSSGTMPTIAASWKRPAIGSITWKLPRPKAIGSKAIPKGFIALPWKWRRRPNTAKQTKKAGHASPLRRPRWARRSMPGCPIRSGSKPIRP